MVPESKTEHQHSQTPTTTVKFQPDQQEAFWSDLWTTNFTPWKAEEISKPFQQNIERIHEAAGRSKDAVSLRGKHVFLPLCGDTYAIKYFAGRGCHVVGVDLVEKSLRAAMNEHFGISVVASSEDDVLSTSSSSSAESVMPTNLVALTLHNKHNDSPICRQSYFRKS